MTTVQKSLFRPDCEVKIAYPTSGKRGVPAESISKAGGCIVIVELDDLYNLTHTLTGARLSKLSSDIPALKTKARRFWASLDKAQKHVYQTSSDPATVRDCTPAASIALVR